jgi:hypothetical protein
VPVLLIHAGTHKTGTTALQTFLTVNRGDLATAGVYLPMAGRFAVHDGRLTPGHHAIPFELAAGKTDALGAAVDEIASRRMPVGVLSSEEFHPLHADARALAAIGEAAGAVGYAVRIVLYLRPQPFYAESLYAEFLKGGKFPDFSEYVDEIVRNGVYRSAFAFEYGKLVDAFEAAFGTGSVVVRPYAGGRDPQQLFRDFLTVVSAFRGPLDLRGLRNPLPTMNESYTLAELLAEVHRLASERAGSPLAPDAGEFLKVYEPAVDERLRDARFAFLTREDAIRMLERFRHDNVALSTRFGVVLPFVSLGDVPAEDDPRWPPAVLERAVLRDALALWSPSYSGASETC